MAVGGNSMEIGGEGNREFIKITSGGNSFYALSQNSRAFAGAASAPNFSIAMGEGTTVTGENCIAIGRGVNVATNNTNNTIALGALASISENNNYSIAIGYNASLNIRSNNSVILGANATIKGANGVIIGYGAKTNTTGAIAIGAGASATSSSTTGPIAIGYSATADDTSISIGSSASANSGSTAIGYHSMATNGSLAIASSFADNHSFTIGRNYRADGNSIAIGISLSSVSANRGAKNNSIAIGIGQNCLIYAEDSSIAIGTQVNSTHTSVAIGVNSCAKFFSVAIGPDTSTGTGIHNIAIGIGSLVNGKSGCVALGVKGAECYGSNSASLAASWIEGNYSTVIGDGAYTSDDKTLQLGDSSNLSALRCRVSLTVGSDKRDKTDIENVNSALSFVNKLQPVTYVFNHRDKYLIDADGKNKNIMRKYSICEYDKEAHAAGTKKDSRRRVGFLAQDIQSALQSTYNTDNYADIVNDNFYDYTEEEKAAIPEGVENKLTMNYESLIPFAIGAIKELSAKISQLESKLATMELV